MPHERILDENTAAFVVADAFPVSPGHALVIPRRHVASYFDLTDCEVQAVHELLCRARQRLDRACEPCGYNVGVNIGEAAGQTVLHVHVHLIPRYSRDVPDPEGGVRNVIPGKGRYR